MLSYLDNLSFGRLMAAEDKDLEYSERLDCLLGEIVDDFASVVLALLVVTDLNEDDASLMMAETCINAALELVDGDQAEIDEEGNLYVLRS